MTTQEIYELIFAVTVFTAFTGFGAMLLFLNAQGTGGWVDKMIAKRAKAKRKRARQAAAQAKRATPKRASGGRRRAVARTRRAAA